MTRAIQRSQSQPMTRSRQITGIAAMRARVSWLGRERSEAGICMRENIGEGAVGSSEAFGTLSKRVASTDHAAEGTHMAAAPHPTHHAPRGPPSPALRAEE